MAPYCAEGLIMEVIECKSFADRFAFWLQWRDTSAARQPGVRIKTNENPGRNWPWWYDRTVVRKRTYG